MKRRLSDFSNPICKEELDKEIDPSSIEAMRAAMRRSMKFSTNRFPPENSEVKSEPEPDKDDSKIVIKAAVFYQGEQSEGVQITINLPISRRELAYKIAKEIYDHCDKLLGPDV